MLFTQNENLGVLWETQEIIDKKSSLINLEFANEYKNILNLFDSKNKKYI